MYTFDVKYDDGAIEFHYVLTIDFAVAEKLINEMMNFFHGSKMLLKKHNDDVLHAFVEHLSKNIHYLLSIGEAQNKENLQQIFEEGLEGFYPITKEHGMTILFKSAGRIDSPEFEDDALTVNDKPVDTNLKSWMHEYQSLTGFEPMYRDDLKQGKITPEQFKKMNIEWFRSWAEETIYRLEGDEG